MQSNPARSKEYDGRFEIPTFEEILDLAERESARRGRTIGIYPETKHPSFHLELNLPLEDRLLEALRKRKLDRPDGPVFIQSFESANLQYLRTEDAPAARAAHRGRRVAATTRRESASSV